jgi:hypothetical protein
MIRLSVVRTDVGYTVATSRSTRPSPGADVADHVGDRWITGWVPMPDRWWVIPLDRLWVIRWIAGA